MFQWLSKQSFCRKGYEFHTDMHNKLEEMRKENVDFQEQMKNMTKPEENIDKPTDKVE